MAVKKQAGTASLGFAEGAASVTLATLTTLVELHRFSPVNFVKIDTDGYDVKCLRGGEKVIRRDCPTLFFEYSPLDLEAVGEDPMSIWPFLADLGYEKAFFYDNEGVPLMQLNLSQQNEIAQLAAYAKNRPLYYDVLVWHRSRNSQFASWAVSEGKINTNGKN